MASCGPPSRRWDKGRRDEPDLVWVKEVALDLPNKAWRRIKWRGGSADWLSSRFARLRVRAGHCHRPTIAHRSGY
jgi:hypothetical protein